MSNKLHFFPTDDLNIMIYEMNCRYHQNETSSGPTKEAVWSRD